MDRKGFGAVLDETVSKMEHDVRVLKTQDATLRENLKLLEKTRDKLSQEIAEGEQKLAGVKKEYQEKVDGMLKSAQDKLDKATEKESQSSIKLSELNDKTKEVEGLIKSNQGLQKNLNKQDEECLGKIAKLKEVIGVVSEILKSI